MVNIDRARQAVGRLFHAMQDAAGNLELIGHIGHGHTARLAGFAEFGSQFCEGHGRPQSRMSTSAF